MHVSAIAFACKVFASRAEQHMTTPNRPEQTREAQTWATQRAQATQSNPDPEQILYKCYRVHVSKSVIFSRTLGSWPHAANTNYVYTLLRQLGEEGVDGKDASRKGILENKPF